MAGCRPLKGDEKTQVPDAFDGPFALRDRLLFLLMRYTSFRISEALWVQVKHVFNGIDMLPEIRIPPEATKGKKRGKAKPLNPKIRPHLHAWIETMRNHGWYAPDAPLFYSPATGRAMDRATAHRHFKAVYSKLGLPGLHIRGRLATHVPRKTVAEEVMKRTNGNLIAVMRALDQVAITSTQRYVEFPDEELESIFMDL
jgi:site-specific recombinase XerC